MFGQTFSAFVDDRGGLQLMYPALDSNGTGSINLAHRPWSEPFAKHGFWVSAPRASAVAVMAKTFTAFQLNLTARVPTGGSWGLRWNDRSSFGVATSASVRNRTVVQFDGRGAFAVSQEGSVARMPARAFFVC